MSAFSFGSKISVHTSSISRSDEDITGQNCVTFTLICIGLCFVFTRACDNIYPNRFPFEQINQGHHTVTIHTNTENPHL